MIPTYLIDKAESKEVEKTPSDMVALCYDLICAETELAEAVEYKKCWESDECGGKRLTNLKRRHKRKKTELEQQNLSPERIEQLEA